VERTPLSALAGLLCGDIGQALVVIPLQAGWIGRRFGEAGHVLRIIAARFVKSHLKFNQADSMMPGRLPQRVEDAEND
jgi:hypothetical protein